MSAGTTAASNCSAVRSPSARTDSLRVVPCSCARFAAFAALSYPMTGLRAVTSMSDSRMICSMRAVLASSPRTQWTRKPSHAVARRRADESTLAIMTGLKTLSSKWP
eukprot:Amastigsp_a516913_19.p6 type:complete len:107 gc:universal Amastigsp_a516913_19:39-359(+)